MLPRWLVIAAAALALAGGGFLAGVSLSGLQGPRTPSPSLLPSEPPVTAAYFSPEELSERRGTEPQVLRSWRIAHHNKCRQSLLITPKERRGLIAVCVELR